MRPMHTDNKKDHLASRREFSSLNPMKVLTLMRRHWYYYLAAILITIGGAYFYLKNKIPIYKVASSVLIGEGGQRQPGEDLLQGIMIRPGLQNIENQIEILSSYRLTRMTVEDLPFEIDVFRKGLFSTLSYFPMSPIKIEAGEDGLPYGIEFTMEYHNEDELHLFTSSRNTIALDTIIRFGQIIKLDQGSFNIQKQPELNDIYSSRKEICFKFYTKEDLTDEYLRRLNVELINPEGGIMRLSLRGTNRIKDILFLNKLAEVFIRDNLDKKNSEAERIIQFIDAQLVDVSESLELTERQLQDFRSRNQIMDVSVQAGQIVSRALQYDNEKARLTLERDYFYYLEEYLSKEENTDNPILPASMGVSDPLLSNLIQELAGLQTEFYNSGVGSRNPMQSQLELRIRNTKRNINEALSGIKLANKMELDENQRQITNINREAQRLPEKEQQLLGFQRKFNLNNVLYTYLLQERAEAGIQKASNKSDHELVDQARLMELVSPLPRNVLLFAFVLALGLPTLLLIIGEMFRTTIKSEEDLTFVNHLPVVAQLPNSRLNYKTVVLSEPNSRISEAFRSLRTRMDFFARDIKSPVVLLTSAMSGEGKTFCSINLASAYSLAGKKTLLVGFDLRRPNLAEIFSLRDVKGLTSYLIGQAKLDEVIYKTDFENLDILPSGDIPPNPGELASSEKAQDIFKELKEKYDYILVDSPPIGIVSDILPLASKADVVLMVVRHGRTKKYVLSSTLREIDSYGIKGISMIVNGILASGDRYSYSYKYKYEYKIKAKTKANSKPLVTEKDE